MRERATDVGVRARVLAIVSLLAAALLMLAVIGFLARNGWYVVAGIAGVVVAVAGAWWVITEAMPRRAVGLVGVLAGAGLFGFALIGAGSEDWASVVRFAVALVLLAVTLLSARWALTAAAAGFAVVLGIALGVPDQIFATVTQYAFLAAVATVGTTATIGAAVLQRQRP